MDILRGFESENPYQRLTFLHQICSVCGRVLEKNIDAVDHYEEMIRAEDKYHKGIEPTTCETGIPPLFPTSKWWKECYENSLLGCPQQWNQELYDSNFRILDN